MGKLNSGGNAAATNSDITGILGPIDSDKLLEILCITGTLFNMILFEKGILIQHEWNFGENFHFTPFSMTIN